MTRARAEEIARTLSKRHVVFYRSQQCLVVNVSRALVKGTPVADLYLTTDLQAPMLQGGFPAPYRQVWEMKPLQAARAFVLAQGGTLAPESIVRNRSKR